MNVLDIDHADCNNYSEWLADLPTRELEKLFREVPLGSTELRLIAFELDERRGAG